MSLPLISVITSTWQRHDMLLERCVPSVQAQTYPNLNHIVVSDGPDPVLRELLIPHVTGRSSGISHLSDRHRLWYYELAEHDPAQHWGHLARARGTELAAGALITYCDDDDALRLEHCALLAALLAARPDCGFALSRMASHQPDGDRVVGHGTPACGNVGTPMIMHRRELLEVATWDHAGAFEDWDLVLAWMQEGVTWCQADAETIDVWPSVFR